MINKVILLGNLGKDPEIRQSKSGVDIGNLTLATSDRRKNQSGEWEDHTEWHRLVVLGKTATNAGQYLRKGSKVYVEGKIQTRKWTNKEGNDQWTTEVLVNQLKFLDKKGENGGGGSGGGNSSKPSGGGSYGGSNNQGGGYGGDDDIPF